MNSSRKLLINVCDYLKSQLEDESECSMEEIESIAKIASRELDARGTISDFAKFYGQSESNVKNVIGRRFIPKDERPKRQVTYRLGWFDRMKPKSWERK